MKRFTGITAALVFCVSSQANAFFIDDYSGWSKLSADAKAGVMIGMADESQEYATEDSELRKAMSVGSYKCFTHLQIKAGALVNTVESWYLADETRKGMPVYVAFYSAVTQGLCRPFVEQETRKVLSKSTPT